MIRALALIDGRLVPEERATVFWNDPGFRRGYGVFETIRVASGRAFLAGCHALRLSETAPLLGIDPWLHPRTLVRRLQRLVEKSGTEDGVLRVFLTPGPAGAGQALSVPRGLIPGDGESRRAVGVRGRYLGTLTSREMPPPCARATLAPHLRDPASPLVGIKTMSYAEEQLLLVRARSAGFDECLRRNLSGRISEGTWSNIFLIEGPALVTPPLGEGLLAGITRWFVLMTALENGFEAQERPVSVERLLGAEEAFLTSTTRGIVPLVALDGRPVGTGNPGAQTLRLAAVLERHVTGGTRER